jgi:hypothetical protein
MVEFDFSSEPAMFVRFVVAEIDGNSGRRQGLFRAARALEDSGALNIQDVRYLEDIRDWFNENLEKPTRLAISSRHHGKSQALSWFKDTSTNHIEKMRDLGNLLDRYGVQVEMIVAKRLGYILYEDAFQVAAFPFSDTPT